MNSNTPFPIPIEHLMREAERLTKTHQIPNEAVLTHALAMASALAGDLVTFRPPGDKDETRATFPLVVITPDAGLPAWIGDQWQALQQQRDASDNTNSLLRSPAALAEQRRMNRVMDLVDPHRHHVSNLMTRSLARPSQQKSFGQINIISKSGKAPPTQKQRQATQLVAGLRLFRPLLRHLSEDPESTGTTPPNHITWLQKRDLRTLAREEGPAVLSKLSTIIGCDAATRPADDEPPHVPQMAALILKILSLAKFQNRCFNFQPSSLVAETLDAETAKILEILNKQPVCLREHLVPEPRLAWHFSALLAAMCAGQDDEGSDLPAAVVGSMLAAWAVRSHIHLIKQTFPADDEGFFEGRDLTICRLLGQLPVPLRRIQRSLHGERKEGCLQSLQRAVKIGLAIETSAGHFAAGPGPEVDLSDFSTDQQAKCLPCQESAPKFTDSPDKNPS